MGKYGIVYYISNVVDRVWFVDRGIINETGSWVLVFGLSWAAGLTAFGPGLIVLFLDFWCE